MACHLSQKAIVFRIALSGIEADHYTTAWLLQHWAYFAAVVTYSRPATKDNVVRLFRRILRSGILYKFSLLLNTSKSIVILPSLGVRSLWSKELSQK